MTQMYPKNIDSTTSIMNMRNRRQQDPTIHHTQNSISDLPNQFVDLACGYQFSHRKNTISTREETLSRKSHFSRDQLPQASKSVLPEQQETSKITKLLKDLKNTYEEHQIDRSYGIVRQIKLEKEQNTKFVFSKQQKQLMQIVEEQYTDLISFDRELAPETWTYKTEKSGIRISTKRQGKSVGVLAETELAIPIEVFLTILTDIDLMKDVVPFMESSSLVAMPQRNCRIGHTVNNFPILSKRQALFEGLGYDRLDYNQTIFLFTRSIHGNAKIRKRYNLQQWRPFYDQSVMVDYKYLLLEFRPIDRHRGYLKFAANTDLHVPAPMFLLDILTQGFGYDMVNNIIEASKKFKGSQWQKNMKVNPQFYQFIEEKKSKFLAQIEKNSADQRELTNGKNSDQNS